MRAFALLAILALATAAPMEFENFFNNSKPHVNGTVFECAESFVALAQQAFHVYQDVEHKEWDQAFNDLMQTINAAESTFNICFDKHLDVFHPADGADFTKCYHDIHDARDEIVDIVKNIRHFRLNKTADRLADLEVTIQDIKHDCIDEYNGDHTTVAPMLGFSLDPKNITQCVNTTTDLAMNIVNIFNEVRQEKVNVTDVIDEVAVTFKELTDVLTDCGFDDEAKIYDLNLPTGCIDALDNTLTFGWVIFENKDNYMKAL